MSEFPLSQGDRGEAVRDLQRRLHNISAKDLDGHQPGTFCEQTLQAVKAFQRDHGLVSSGQCDELTWRAIIEAEWTLGDRLLMLTAPNMRGEDVATLQSRLALIGFDPGRADGIYGNDTDRALRDFQSNSGLRVDGVAGGNSIRTLNLFLQMTGDGPGVSVMRQLEELNAVARSFSDLRIIVGQFGGLSSLARQTVQELRQRSATVIVTDAPDASVQAAVANRFRATAYVGFSSTDSDHSHLHYFAVPQFESTGGRILAEFLAEELSVLAPHLRPEVAGMRLPVLRETRMPAVLFHIGSVQESLDQAAVIVNATVIALSRWIDQPYLSTNPQA